MRRYTFPACDADTGQPRVNAPTVSPATSAPLPSTPCAKVGTYEVRPSRIAPTSSEARLLATTMRRVKTHSGSTGFAARRSTSPKAASTTAPPTNSARLCGEVQAHACPPSSSARISAPAPRVSSPAPR